MSGRAGEVHAGDRLSAREVEVMGAVADGLSNAEAALRLGLRDLSVKSHLARIATKLGVGERSGLVGAAIVTGQLPVARGGVVPSRFDAKLAELLPLMARGLEVAEIAAKLGMNEHTVKSRLARMMQVLDVRNRAQAVAVAFRLGLLDADALAAAAGPVVVEPVAPEPVPKPVPAKLPEPVVRPTTSPAPAPASVSGACPVLAPAAVRCLIVVAESVVAGKPPAVVRRLALEALTAAGRRGPGGRPLPQGAVPVSIPAARTPGALGAGSGSSRASQAASGALRPVPGAVPSRPSGADAPQPSNGAPA